MLYTVEEDLQLCLDFKVSPKQLMFIKMLSPNLSLDEQERRKVNYATALKFKQELKGLSADELSDMISREILIDLNDPGKIYHEYFEINPKFAHKFALAIYPMVSELHDTYPKFFYGTDGKEFIAKNCSANEISMTYLKAIDKDPIKHKAVIDSLKWAIQNKAIVVGLKKFVDIRYWEALDELRLKKKGGFNNVNIG